MKRIEKMVYIAEYKRRQSAPGVKLTEARFGLGRKYPITNGYRDESGRMTDRPLRPVADRPPAPRQCPPGAAQLAVRAGAVGHATSCGSTTPTASARPRSSRAGIVEDLRWLGIDARR